MRALLSAIACAMALAPPAALAQDTDTMKIRFTIDGKELATATLMDNATARDFLSLLPLTVALEDYAATEKITYLPRKLSTAGAPAGSDPSVYAKGLLPLGRVDSSIKVLRAADRSKVTIEPAAR